MNYTERPPATARAARRAWDYFTAKYPGKKIGTLVYSPKCDGLPGWIAEWEYTAEQRDYIMGCWGAGYWTDWMAATAPASTIAAWH